MGPMVSMETGFIIIIISSSSIIYFYLFIFYRHPAQSL